MITLGSKAITAAFGWGRGGGENPIRDLQEASSERPWELRQEWVGNEERDGEVPNRSEDSWMDEGGV